MCFELCSADEIRTQILGGCVGVVCGWTGGEGGAAWWVDQRAALSGVAVLVAGPIFHFYLKQDIMKTSLF